MSAIRNVQAQNFQEIRQNNQISSRALKVTLCALAILTSFIFTSASLAIIISSIVLSTTIVVIRNIRNRPTIIEPPSDVIVTNWISNPPPPPSPQFFLIGSSWFPVRRIPLDPRPVRVRDTGTLRSPPSPRVPVGTGQRTGLPPDPRAQENRSSARVPVGTGQRILRRQ